MSKEDARAYDTPIAEDGISPENSGAGIDHATVTDSRMALDSSDGIPLTVGLQPLSAESDRMIDPHVGADLRRLTDNDAGAMVYTKARTYACARVYVNART